MKKLLFTLAAAATCGVAAAAPGTATFDGATFDPTKADDGEAISESNRGYWEIDVSTDPELKAAGEDNAALGYLQINTGSTPLWRTFAGVDSHVSATNAALDAAAVDADGVVVSSDVKLTACTEWPTLTDFANEKLALFLFAPEEGDTSGKTAGLYAVGGAMVDGNLTATAYRLNAEPNAITNTDGWATIAIKSYADVYVNNNGAKYPAFVIAACKKGSATTNILSVATGEAYAPGYTVANLSNAAKARIDNRELIPSTKTSDGKLVGLGFQGEGGIDNVSLATTDFAVDAVAMTVDLTDATLTEITGAKVTSLSADGNLEFVPGTETITFKVSAAEGMVVTVKLGNVDLEADNAGVYSFTPAANAKLTVTAAAAAFQIGEGENAKKYATLDKALDDLTSGGTLKLLGALELGANLLTFDQMDESGVAIDVVLDLNGQTISGSGTSDANAVIVVAGANLTIKDSVGGGKILPLTEGGYAVYNTLGALEIQAGAYDGAVVTAEGATTSITDGKFKVTEGIAVPTGKKWSAADAYGYYTLVNKAGNTPTVGEGEGSVEVDSTTGDAEITPADGKTEVTVTIPSGFTGNIIVPSTVTTVKGGVPAEKLGLKIGNYTVIGAFKINETSYAIELNKDATVKVGNEDIRVEPELANTAADGETEVAPFEAGAEPAATVKTIPGLTYSLDFDSDVKGAFGTSAASKQADGNRMTLQDKTDKTGVTKRFYKIRVRK